MSDARVIPTTPAEAAVPRLAATVLLLREGDGGVPEVLMLRRHQRAGGFAAGMWVFPGGTVDPADRTLPAQHWSGIDPVRLEERFGLTADAVLGMHVAAVRETFEESGVLLVVNQPAALVELRQSLSEDIEADAWARFLTANDLVADLSSMTYWLRWRTPIQEPKRYDTCFFLARVPEGATPLHDAVETTETRWITAHEALTTHDFQVIFPTARTLEGLREFATIDEALQRAAAQERIDPVQPHIFVDEEGRYTGIVLPDDPRYPHELYA